MTRYILAIYCDAGDAPWPGGTCAAHAKYEKSDGTGVVLCVREIISALSDEDTLRIYTPRMFKYIDDC